MKEYSLEYFSSRGLAFALMKEEKILYKSKKPRLLPLLFCLKKYKKQMRGAMVYDKVIGRAAALLLVYGGVKKVLTPLISRGALQVLARGGAEVEYEKIVKNILNIKGDDLCPMEKLSQGKGVVEFAKIMGV